MKYQMDKLKEMAIPFPRNKFLMMNFLKKIKESLNDSYWQGYRDAIIEAMNDSANELDGLNSEDKSQEIPKDFLDKLSKKADGLSQRLKRDNTVYLASKDQMLISIDKLYELALKQKSRQ